jgi:hypothetical protein
MTDLLQMRVFFFISSIGFVVVTILVSILLVRIIRITHAFEILLAKASAQIATIGDTTKEMIDDIHDSTFFNFLFKGRSKHTKTSVSHRAKKDTN